MPRLPTLALLLLAGCAPVSAQEDPGHEEAAEPTPDPAKDNPMGGDSPEVIEAEREGELLPENFGVGTFVPRDGEHLKLEAKRDGETREVPHRGVIHEDEVVVFVTRVDPAGDEYVYLLEGTGGPPRMIHPRMGRVHLSSELGGERRIRPRPAHEVVTGEEDEPEGWQVTGGGWAEYRLVATPSPRDESAAGSLGSYERFLMPPPYATGKAAGGGRLVDSIIVRWD